MFNMTFDRKDWQGYLFFGVLLGTIAFFAMIRGVPLALFAGLCSTGCFTCMIICLSKPRAKERVWVVWSDSGILGVFVTKKDAEWHHDLKTLERVKNLAITEQIITR